MRLKMKDITPVEQKEYDIWNYPLDENYPPGENYPFEEAQVSVFTNSTSDALWEYWYSCQKYMSAI